MRHSILTPRFMPCLRLASLSVAVIAATTACAKTDVPPANATSTLAPVPPDSAAPHDATASLALTPVRGTIAAISDTALTITTATGPEVIRIVPPLRVYARTSSDLAHVTPNAFVGITSVEQPNGSERATEIHVFPEELRGTGEGSRMMAVPAGTGGRGTMMKGALPPARMTNGNVSISRMTNGTVGGSIGGTYTVQYQGGTQKIMVPANVAVTIIAPTQTKLALGANVIVIGMRGPDGRTSASSVMLTGPEGGR
ncbi:MAG: hypothetical protein M3Z05_12450 [Gemmatimonadota bacterium]|nr:hypothetical protein [Gemmatimonadota bacterium]